MFFYRFLFFHYYDFIYCLPLIYFFCWFIVIIIIALQTAVGTTFNSLVMDSEMDVMVQLFLPWSSDCRNAAKVLEKVAKKV